MNTSETTKEYLTATQSAIKESEDMYYAGLRMKLQAVGVSMDGFQAFVEKIKNHYENEIKNSHIKILQNEIKRLEGEKKDGLFHLPMEERLKREATLGFSPEEIDAYNQAIQDQITHYKEQIELIKKI